MKNHLNCFTFTVIELIPCLHFFTDNNNTIIQLSALTKNCKPLAKDTLLYNFASYYAKYQCSECIKSYFKIIINPTSKLHLFLNKEVKSIMDLLHSCTGHIHITYQILGTEVENFSEIQTICIISPKALSTLANVHYLELGDSFDGMKPYAYCIIQGIVLIESIPLRITIAPSECLSLYHIFFDEISDLIDDEIDWSQMAAVSDIHSSIKSVFKTHDIYQLLCYKNLLEHFSSSCSLSIFANKLLKCFSLNEYLSIADEVIKDIDEYIIERTKIRSINEDFLLKISEIGIMASFEDSVHQSDYYCPKLVLCARRSDYVGCCSNHNEAFHI